MLSKRISSFSNYELEQDVRPLRKSKNNNNIIVQVLTAASMKMTAYWVVRPCSLQRAASIIALMM
jgi:hypothetical protein